MRVSTVAAALAFLSIPTVASAHAGNNDPNMVHACIGNASKIVRIVGVTGSCLSSPVLGETAVHWPQVPGSGTQGQKGEKGDQGIPGPQGNPGTSGANGTSVAFLGYLLPGGATCANGGVVYASGNPPENVSVCNGKDGAAGGTRAAGPCFGNSRYVDCGNGTVTDSLSGLIWLRQANCLPRAEYVAANQSAAGLKAGDCGLTDGSSPGDWRLPTGDEWTAMIARGTLMGCSLANGNAPSLTDDFGLNCLSAGPSSFVGVEGAIYSGSSTYEGDMAKVVVAFLGHGVVSDFGKGNVLRVWPVRGGNR